MLVIIGLMTSAVVLTLPSPNSDFEKYTGRLAIQLNQMVEQSVLASTPTAFGLSEDEYSFYRSSGDTWDVVETKAWPDQVTLILTVRGAPLKLSSDINPAIIAEPTGFVTPFELQVSSDDEAYSFAATPRGFIERSRISP